MEERFQNLRRPPLLDTDVIIPAQTKEETLSVSTDVQIIPKKVLPIVTTERYVPRKKMGFVEKTETSETSHPEISKLHQVNAESQVNGPSPKRQTPLVRLKLKLR